MESNGMKISSLRGEIAIAMSDDSRSIRAYLDALSSTLYKASELIENSEYVDSGAMPISLQTLSPQEITLILGEMRLLINKWPRVYRHEEG